MKPWKQALHQVCEGQTTFVVETLEPALKSAVIETFEHELGVGAPPELLELYAKSDGVNLVRLDNEGKRFYTDSIFLPLKELVEETLDVRDDESDAVDLSGCVVLARTEITVYLLKQVGPGAWRYLAWDPGMDEIEEIGSTCEPYFAYWRTSYVTGS